ncbi:MAG: hypothetical protein CMN57_03735 [Gammaproteobacteria bacterium]|nr:hypothetical protein [Gammaproteobacteria bacterium]
MYCRNLCLATLLSGAFIATPAAAAIYEFHFTGQYTLLDPIGGFMDQKPISSTLTYNDQSGSGFSAGMTIEDFETVGATATIHDISLQRHEDSNYIIGNMLADWNNNYGVPVSMVWDASGLFNAIALGLQEGDVISGTYLKRGGSTIANVGSAIPASDGTLDYNGIPLDQGPAPLAVTTLNTSLTCTPGTDCMGNALSGTAPFTDDGIAGSPLIDGPFVGLNVNFDIGSGNSLTVQSISSVPLPGTAWLFATGLLGLITAAKRRKTA